MADGPILGTTFVEIQGDVSKLAPQLQKAENLAQQSAKNIEKTVGASLGNITTDLDKRISTSTATIQKLNKAYDDTGLATDRNLKKLVAQQIALRESIVSTYGSLSKATPTAQAQYAALSNSIAQATLRTRELNHEFQLQRMLSSPSGAPRTLEGAAELGLAQAGLGGLAMRIPQVAAYSFLAIEELRIIGEVGTALGTQWKQWADIAVGSIDKVAGHIGDKSRDMLAASWWRFLPGFADSTGTPGGLAANVDDILKGASYGNWQRYAKLKYTINPNQYNEPAGPDSSGFVKQLQIQDAINGLKLQEAALTGNKAAMAALNAELDANKIKELEAGGYTHAQAEAIVAEEQSLRKLTDTLKVFTQSSTKITAPGGVTYGGITASMMTPQNPIDKYYERIAYAFNNEDVIATRMVNPIEAALQKLSDDYDANAKHYKQAMQDATYAVEGLFTNVLVAGFKGNIKSISEAWHSMITGLEHDLAQFLAHEAVKKLLALLLSSYQNYQASSMTNSFFGAYFGANGGGFANGGIVPGGFRAFASGGKVTQPTLGLVGEGDYNEAVVPLPDGNRIPVQFTGKPGKSEKHEVSITLDKGLLIAAATAASQDAQRQVLINIKEGGPMRRELENMVRSQR